MKWQFHLTVFVKIIVAHLFFNPGKQPMPFNFSISLEKPEAENMWHRLCQCDVVTAML
jgi:hypothetical protein